MGEKLILRWDKRAEDHICVGPNHRDMKGIMDALFSDRVDVDGRIMPSIASILEGRGYDLTTLRLEVSRTK